MRTKVLVAGAAGRMGQETIRTILDDKDLQLVGAVGRKDSELIGKDIGTIVGKEKAGVLLTENLKDAMHRSRPHVMVDFTIPSAVYSNAVLAISCGVHSVLGATGMSADEIDELDKKAKFAGTAVLVAPNFALGAVLMIEAAKLVAKYFEHVEVIEMHHDKKVDAPSGTAIKTVNELAKVRDFNHKELSPNEKARGDKLKGINVHSIRLPGLVAHEEIIFGGIGQTLTLRHDTIDRTAFMPGVAIAVKEIGKHKGLIYGLENLLNL
ncbi:MAG: 4-hydroxy-tetrahydrodipicolinate reductase [Candidatus Caenarcaniphilales bacterium]|nr:4-hydroxy-tetrahydrodipicolinate reductase [Candidatus Caenarcaniphilales bacterium]